MPGRREGQFWGRWSIYLSLFDIAFFIFCRAMAMPAYAMLPVAQEPQRHYRRKVDADIPSLRLTGRGLANEPPRRYAWRLISRSVVGGSQEALLAPAHRGDSCLMRKMPPFSVAQAPPSSR